MDGIEELRVRLKEVDELYNSTAECNELLDKYIIINRACMLIRTIAIEALNVANELNHKQGGSIMPKPKPFETKEVYIKRAVRYFIEEEGLSQKEAVGRAYGYWETYRKKDRLGG